jgi:hypothetical protein
MLTAVVCLSESPDHKHGQLSHCMYQTLHALCCRVLVCHSSGNVKDRHTQRMQSESAIAARLDALLYVLMIIA